MTQSDFAWPGAPPPPERVDSGIRTSGGLDLLGLRQPALVVSNYLLDGITTVTPHVRNLTFRAWIINRYINSGGPSSASAYSTFAKAAEAAIAIGNVLTKRNVVGVTGADGAREIVGATSDMFSLSSLVEQPAVSLYQGPSVQLGITPADQTRPVPGLTTERGLVLAELLDDALADNELAGRFVDADPPTAASRDELTSFGATVFVDAIPDEEREALVGCLMPTEPFRDSEVRRARTYGLLLHLADVLGAPPAPTDVFDHSVARHDGDVFERARFGWTIYTVRDLIGVAHEFSLFRLMAELSAAPGRRDVGTAVVRRVLERNADAVELMRSLNLLRAGEDLLSMPVQLLRERVADRTGSGSVRAGVRSWDGPLVEHELLAEFMVLGDGVVAMLPLVWVLACERLLVGAEGDEGFVPGLDASGWGRMGVDAVIRPEVEGASTAGRTVGELALTAANRLVDQHLRISWARLRVELQRTASASEDARDVSLLRTEGDEWVFAQTFRPGEANSRLGDAVSWLRQLGLVDDNGITDIGKVHLNRTRQMLEERAR